MTEYKIIEYLNTIPVGVSLHSYNAIPDTLVVRIMSKNELTGDIHYYTFENIGRDTVDEFIRRLNNERSHYGLGFNALRYLERLYGKGIRRLGDRIV